MCSDCSSLPELGGQAARYFDPNDEEHMAQVIVEALVDATLREEMQARGHEQAQRFSWTRAAKETFSVYEKVLKGLR